MKARAAERRRRLAPVAFRASARRVAMLAAQISGSGGKRNSQGVQNPGRGDEFDEEQNEEPGLAREARDLRDRPGNREAEQNEKEKIAEADWIVRRNQMLLGQSGSGPGKQSAHLQAESEAGGDRADPKCPEERALHSAGRSPPGP